VYCSAGYGVGAGAVKVAHTAGKWDAAEIYRVPGDKELANHWSTPVVHKGHMYGMFQFKAYGDGPIKCVELATGKVKWERPGFGPGNVVLAGDKVIALSDAGELVLFAADPAGYKELARSKILEGKCWTTPVLSDGRIYARSTREAVCLAAGGK
jgi:outer membrane protein assembly factor BamB